MAVSVISLIIGISSLIYFLVYVILAGANNSFTFVWAVLGVFGIIYSLVHRRIADKGSTFLKRMEKTFGVILAILLVLFLVVLGNIIRESGKSPKPGADYVIVLGAHVYGERMSTNLLYRVKAAYEYLKDNPDTKVVLSGGKGDGENITEAEAMRRFLVEKGISTDRILLDETSVNTDENIKNSMQMIGDKKKRVVLVSNNFHIYRAKGIARKQGYENVEGIGSRTVIYTMPNCYVREVVAVIKYKLCGQIS